MADTKKTTVQETEVQESKQSAPVDKNVVKELFDLQEQIEKEKISQEPTQPAQMDGITVKELLNYINMVRADNTDVIDALKMLDNMDDGENAGPGSSGNTLGAAKATAIADIVRCRETTNQKILSIYEKMYCDLVETPDNRKFQTACNLDLARLETKERLVKALFASDIDSDTVARILTDAEDLFT